MMAPAASENSRIALFNAMIQLLVKNWVLITVMRRKSAEK